MSDMFDKASDTEEQFRSLAIEEIRKNIGKTKYTGRCLCCNAQIETKGMFCSCECREDYELNQRLSRITGRVT